MNIAVKDLTKPIGTRASAIPKFWKEALIAIRKLKLVQYKPDEMKPADALAHPIWHSPLFNIREKHFDTLWRESLEMRTMRDCLNLDEKREYTLAEIEAYIRGKLQCEGDTVLLRHNKTTTIPKLLKSWSNMRRDIPQELRSAALGGNNLPGYSKIAQQMMRYMGWSEGEPLGNKLGGMLEPIPTVHADAYNDRRGLGWTPPKWGNTPRKKTETERCEWVREGDSHPTDRDSTPQPRKHRKTPYKALLHEGEIIYGKLTNQTFNKADLSTKGKPVPTGNTIMVDPGEVREVQYWAGGIRGMAEMQFPDPKGWRLTGIDKNLDKITVKDLTAALTRLHTKKPSCKNAWEIRRRSFTPEAGAASHTVPPPDQANTQPHPSATHPPPLPWMEIANRYTVGLQTPKDFGSHYKNIIHRSMWTNPHNPTARSPNCRLCKQTRETITHFGECPRLMPIFKALRLLDDSPRWDDKTLNLLGVLPSGKVLPRGISMIHFIFWKFTLIAVTKLGIDGTPIDEDEIIRSARERIHTRIKSAKMQLHLTRLEAQSRRREPNFNKMKKSLSGLGQISEEGEFEPNDIFTRFIETISEENMWKLFDSSTQDSPPPPAP